MTSPIELANLAQYAPIPQNDNFEDISLDDTVKAGRFYEKNLIK